MKPSSYPSPIVIALGENGWDATTFPELPRNFLEWIFSGRGLKFHEL
jgi:hypothetical protein